jgi:biopolymer transport protein ExbD
LANGQWSGTLDLEVDANGAVTGRYRSDETGKSYRVTGDAQKRAPHAIELTVQFPRSTMTLDGWIWTEGKAAISGTATLLDRSYGFVAVRAGESIDPASPHAAPEQADSTPDLTLEIAADGTVRLGGAPVADEALQAALAESRKHRLVPTVRIVADPSVQFSRVGALLDLIRETGPADFVFAPATKRP